jgi:drug/metabolite transporter (DMT)-like permease
MLLAAAEWWYRKLPKPGDLPAVAALGLCLFLNQLLYILGLQLAGVNVATCLQPTMPVFTVLICMFIGQEHISFARVVGVPRHPLGRSGAEPLAWWWSHLFGGGHMVTYIVDR